ncbi:MAG: hypothetical protein IJW09_02505 [Clostridia bacterium]|nr:hypothetical protein [Clostridia bacterium]
MKNNNRVEKYFNQKNFSVAEWIFLAVAIVAGFVATFIWGGGPIGTPVMLIGIIGFTTCRSFKVKDAEVDRLLENILEEKQVERTENTLVGYDLNHTVLKKRKDGKVISPKYYVTNITFTSSETILQVNVIDLISVSVEKERITVDERKSVEVVEENIKTLVGPRKMTYIKIEDNDMHIPVTLTDYQSSQLMEKFCSRHVKS